ncbi:hypothetical protein [Streptomyces natalensis]|uniref:C2H2-type domain-containing protein n=1 Tax=Streptomyces natalensis ATCC 27448 TaxID=1240678 RepID=A0A0D7CT16_9ACTN|nr:hypothetical protein [Streptomyces natalensis]KIZ18995.1 hypothetical protein SNA_04530 [Streptomyces natalensis ATCC 27448]
MSDIAKTTSTANPRGVSPFPRSAEPAAHEAYAFACMRCGHGWEQAYEIEHHVDAKGELHVVYYADGERVPSPLTRPLCVSCGSNVVRIMRSGQVSMVSDAIANMHQRQGGHAKNAKNAKNAKKSAAPSEAAEDCTDGDGDDGRHHWHLSDLLHPIQAMRK